MLHVVMPWLTSLCTKNAGKVSVFSSKSSWFFSDERLAYNKLLASYLCIYQEGELIWSQSQAGSELLPSCSTDYGILEHLLESLYAPTISIYRFSLQSSEPTAQSRGSSNGSFTLCVLWRSSCHRIKILYAFNFSSGSEQTMLSFFYTAVIKPNFRLVHIIFSSITN